jgi:hypothetical protein
MCVSTPAVRALSNSEELVLEGRTADKGASSVVYSLRGYRGAIQEMNRLCNNTEKTGWLVKEAVVDPEFDGRIVSTFDDWKIGEDTSRAKKECYAFSIAKSYSPEDWREVRPYMYYFTEDGSESVGVRLDISRYYDKSGSLKAIVRTNGDPQPIPAAFRDAIISFNEPCKGKSGMCLSQDVLRRIGNADELVLEGRSEDKRSTVITYSLRGYRAAIQEMTKVCAAKVQWLLP